MKIKKLLAGILAGAMVLGSLTTVSAEEAATSGSGTNSDLTITGLATDSTTDVALTGDFEITYKFNVVSTDENIWDNFLIEVHDTDSHDSGNWLTLNPTNYNGWGVEDSLTFSSNVVSDTEFLTAAAAGLDCVVTLTRIGTSFSLVATMGDYVFYADAEVSAWASTETLYVHLSGEDVKLTGITWEWTNDVTATTYTETKGTLADLAKSEATDSLDISGDFTITYTFTGVKDSGYSWDGYWLYFADGTSAIAARADRWYEVGYGTMTAPTSYNPHVYIGNIDTTWATGTNIINALCNATSTYTVTATRRGGMIDVMTVVSNSANDADVFYSVCFYVPEWDSLDTISLFILANYCTISDISYVVYTEAEVEISQSETEVVDTDGDDDDADTDTDDDDDDTTTTASSGSSATGDSYGFVLFLAGAIISMGAVAVARKKFA